MNKDFDSKYYTQIVRPRAVTGAFVAWKGNSLLSRIIRRWSEYSHASLVVRLKNWEQLKNRVFLVEALKDGLQLRLLSQRLQGFDGHADLFIPRGLASDVQKCIGAQALYRTAQHIGYDFDSLFKNMLGRVNMDAKKFFCSEWVYYDLVACGIRTIVPYKKAPRPGDLPKWIRCKKINIM